MLLEEKEEVGEGEGNRGGRAAWAKKQGVGWVFDHDHDSSSSSSDDEGDERQRRRRDYDNDDDDGSRRRIASLATVPSLAQLRYELTSIEQQQQNRRTTSSSSSSFVAKQIQMGSKRVLFAAANLGGSSGTNKQAGGRSLPAASILPASQQAPQDSIIEEDDIINGEEEGGLATTTRQRSDKQQQQQQRAATFRSVAGRAKLGMRWINMSWQRTRNSSMARLQRAGFKDEMSVKAGHRQRISGDDLLMRVRTEAVRRAVDEDMEQLSSSHLAILGAKLTRQVQREERHSKKPEKIFMPDSPVVRIWDIFVVVSAFYICWYLPIAIGFSEDNRADYKDALFFAIVFFDMVYFSPRTAFQNDKGVVVLERSALWTHYRHHGLWGDIVNLAFFACALLVTFCPLFEPAELRWRIIRVGCLTRYSRCHQWISRRVQRMTSGKNNMQFCQVLFLFCFVSHVLGCLLWAIVTHPRPDQRGWMDRQYSTGASWIEETWFVKYTMSVQNVLSTLVGGTFGPITPEEQIFAAVVLTVGCVLQSILFGEVALIVSQMNRARNMYREVMDEANMYMRNLHIPKELRCRVNHYFEYMWTRTRLMDTARFYRSLSGALKSEVQLHQVKDLLAKVPMFSVANSNFLLNLVARLGTRVFMPGDFVVRSGEIGSDMFFVAIGWCEVLNLSSGQVAVVFTFYEGDFFGEIALITAVRRTATVRAAGYCELTTLAKSDFEEVMEQFPDAADTIFKKMVANVARIEGVEPKVLSQKTAVTGAEELLSDALEVRHAEALRFRKKTLSAPSLLAKSRPRHLRKMQTLKMSELTLEREKLFKPRKRKLEDAGGLTSVNEGVDTSHGLPGGGVSSSDKRESVVGEELLAKFAALQRDQKAFNDTLEAKQADFFARIEAGLVGRRQSNDK